MNVLLWLFLGKFSLVLFDDILIYSKNWSDRLLHVEHVLSLLLSHQFFAKFSKWKFGVGTVDYLGHLIYSQGVKAGLEKIKVIADFPNPTSLTTLKAFLGLTRFYRCFARNYASLASPLTNLLKSSTFSWSEALVQAFAWLEAAMLNLLIFNLLNLFLPFEVTADAFGVAIGAMLSQTHLPIAFFSKKLSPHLTTSTTYIMELYVLTEVVKKWQKYLLGHTFKVFTNHKSLKSLLT